MRSTFLQIKSHDETPHSGLLPLITFFAGFIQMSQNPTHKETDGMGYRTGSDCLEIEAMGLDVIPSRKEHRVKMEPKTDIYGRDDLSDGRGKGGVSDRKRKNQGKHQ
jgi:hypothetical protein